MYAIMLFYVLTLVFGFVGGMLAYNPSDACVFGAIWSGCGMMGFVFKEVVLDDTND